MGFIRKRVLFLTVTAGMFAMIYINARYSPSADALQKAVKATARIDDAPPFPVAAYSKMGVLIGLSYGIVLAGLLSVIDQAFVFWPSCACTITIWAWLTVALIDRAGPIRKQYGADVAAAAMRHKKNAIGLAVVLMVAIGLNMADMVWRLVKSERERRGREEGTEMV